MKRCDILDFFEKRLFKDVAHGNLDIFTVFGESFLQNFESVKISLTEWVLDKGNQRVLSDKFDVVFR